MYCHQNDGTVVFDRISEMIDILIEFPLASFRICGDFKIHHNEYLAH